MQKNQIVKKYIFHDRINHVEKSNIHFLLQRSLHFMT